MNFSILGDALGFLHRWTLQYEHGEDFMGWLDLVSKRTSYILTGGTKDLTSNAIISRPGSQTFDSVGRKTN